MLLLAAAVPLMRGISPSLATIPPSAPPPPLQAPLHILAQPDGRAAQDSQTFSMAPVQLDPQINYVSVGLVVGHVLAAVVLTVGVGRSLYRSYRSLGPSQDTRERLAQRSILVPIFAGLALVSLNTAVYASLRHAILSYKTWASQRDVAIPAQFYGDKGIFSFGDNATDVHLALWTTDTSVHLDAVEILAEKARRFWWGQQIDLGLVPWNLLLAIEGRRRNIPLLWCYSLLGQLVSLSYGQNLFFLALLLTPSPLPPRDASSSWYIRVRDAIFTPKPSNWAPHPILNFVFLVLNYGALSLIPQSVNTPTLRSLVLGTRACSMAPLILPYITPTSWGIARTSPHEAYSTYTKLFRVTSAVGLALHCKATIEGLAYSTPDAYYHRHSIHLPFDVERRSSWERTTSAFGRILAATSDHPVVGGAGSDVLLSAVSLGLWAAVRAVNVQDILASTVPGYRREGLKEPASKSSITPRDRTKAAGDATDTPSVRRRRRSSRKIKQETEQEGSEASYEPTPSEAASVAEGDVLLDTGNLDWESAALIWGLTVFGGLGVGSAGVMGGECIAR